MKRISAAALLLPLLAACSGGGGSGIVTPGPTLLAQESVAREAQSEAVSDAVGSRPAWWSTSDLLYVGNAGNDSITVYRHDAQGDTAPLYTIAGPRTQLSRPGELAQDAQGNLYVANGSYALNQSSSAAILVFAHGARGNVAPLRVLSGPATGIHHVAAMTVDRATGKLFVDDYQFQTAGYLVDVSLLRFPPGAGGNAAPFARSAPGLFPALQLTVASDGRDLIEAHGTNAPSDAGLGVDTLVKQFSNLAPADPGTLPSINALHAQGVVEDATDKTYLVTTDGGILRLADSTSGYGPAEGGSLALTPNARAAITSDTCGSQLALGYLRNIYVTHSKAAGGCPADAVYVYRASANGNAAPLRVLSGPATKLSEPLGIFEGE